MTTPTLEKVMETVQQLGPEDFEGLVSWIVTIERDRRREEAARQKAEMEVIASLVEAGTLEGPEATTEEGAVEDPGSVPAWVDPGTDHTKMYRPGVVVARNERVWLNMVEDRLNHWEPGGKDVYPNIWLDITDRLARPEADEGEVQAEAPDGSRERPYPFEVGRSVKRGDYITYNGELFRMEQDHTMVGHYLPGPGLESIYKAV